MHQTPQQILIQHKEKIGELITQKNYLYIKKSEWQYLRLRKKYYIHISSYLLLLSQIRQIL